MRGTARIEGVEPWLVTGASLYWAAIVVQFLFPAASPSAGLLSDGIAKYLLLAAFVGVGFLAPRLCTSEVGRRGLVGASLAASLVVMLTGADVFGVVGGAGFAPGDAAGPSGAMARQMVRAALHMLSVATLMVLWGFAFASMDKRGAGANVTITMLISTLLILVALALAGCVATSISARVLMMGSLAVLLSGRVRFRDHRRRREPRARGALSSFFLSRLAFGAVMGFAIEAPLRLSVGAISPLLTGLGIVVALAAVGVYVRAADRLYFALPTLLFLTMGVTYLPFFEGGLERAAECVVGLVWLAWAEFSAFQLSDLKERCGLGELALCLTEKLTLSLSMAAGIALFRLVDLTPLLASREVLEVVVFGAACLLMLGAAYAVGCLVGERTEDQLRAELARSRREQVERVYDRLAGEYALSSREREAMGMLAEGYTRAYIREALGVSDGTAKAHIAHIYQKLDVHRKDDLLAFIDAEVSRAESPGAAG